MKKPTDQFFHLEGKTEAERRADLARCALARNEQQLAAQPQVVASASSDWDRLQAEIKMRQLEMDNKFLRGEIPAQSQHLVRGERARGMAIKWDFDALMKIRLK